MIDKAEEIIDDEPHKMLESKAIRIELSIPNDAYARRFLNIYFIK